MIQRLNNIMERKTKNPCSVNIQSFTQIYMITLICSQIACISSYNNWKLNSLNAIVNTVGKMMTMCLYSERRNIRFDTFNVRVPSRISHSQASCSLKLVRATLYFTWNMKYQQATIFNHDALTVIQFGNPGQSRRVAVDIKETDQEGNIEQIVYHVRTSCKQCATSQLQLDLICNFFIA